MKELIQIAAWGTIAAFIILHPIAAVIALSACFLFTKQTENKDKHTRTISTAVFCAGIGFATAVVIPTLASGLWIPLALALFSALNALPHSEPRIGNKQRQNRPETHVIVDCEIIDAEWYDPPKQRKEIKWANKNFLPAVEKNF